MPVTILKCATTVFLQALNWKCNIKNMQCVIFKLSAFLGLCSKPLQPLFTILSNAPITLECIVNSDLLAAAICIVCHVVATYFTCYHSFNNLVEVFTFSRDVLSSCLWLNHKQTNLFKLVLSCEACLLWSIPVIHFRKDLDEASAASLRNCYNSAAIVRLHLAEAWQFSPVML